MTDTTSDAVVQRFLDWAASQGCALSSACVLHDFSAEGMGRGLIATRDIAENELLFEVPRTILLSLRTSRLGAWCEANDEGQDQALRWERDIRPKGWTPLILSMMWEAWQASEEGQSRWERVRSSDLLKAPSDVDGDAAKDISWGPYFDIMPTEFDTPMMWTPSELKELEGTDVFPRVGKKDAEELYETLVRTYVAARPALFLGLPQDADQASIEAGIRKYYSLSQFHTMGSRVLSRSFHVRGGGRGGEEEGEDEDDDDDEQDEDTADISMTPMADMLNARFASDNARLFFKTDVLEMRTTAPIAEGEQIFNTFGDPPNGDLLRRYGHVDEPNGADAVELEADILGQALVEIIAEQHGELARNNLQDRIKARVEFLCSDTQEALLDDAFPLTYLPGYPPDPNPPHATPTSADTADPESSQLGSLIEALDEAVNETGSIGEDLLQCARALCLTDDEFEKRVRGKGRLPSPKIAAVINRPDLASGGGAGSLQICVADVIARACRIRLQVYASTVEQDEAELLASPLAAASALTVKDRRRRAALVVRLGERRVLADHARAFEAAGVAAKQRAAAAVAAGGGVGRGKSKKRKDGGNPGGDVAGSSSTQGTKKTKQ
ncbi:hypothetical protein V8E36_001730 [Tilletia maclaganii]